MLRHVMYDFAALVFSALLLVQNLPAQTPEARTRMLQRAFDQLHHGQYDSALAACMELRRLQPENPDGYVMAAGVYQAMMRLHRVRIFEAELDSFSLRAEQLAQKQTRKSGTAEAWFMLGSAKGNLALQRFHRGEWAAALQDAIHTLNAMKQAMRLDKTFMDPGLALGVYEFWKNKKLGMGLGLFAGKRKDALELLEKVAAEARYLRLDAKFTLQDLYMHEGEHERALAINEEFMQELPLHPSVLQHRAVLLEEVRREEEALPVWEKLYDRLQAFPRPSYAFLAECQLHRARILEGMQAEASQILAAVELAAENMRRRDRSMEMSGPFENFEELSEAIQALRRKYAAASSLPQDAGKR